MSNNKKTYIGVILVFVLAVVIFVYSSISQKYEDANSAMEKYDYGTAIELLSKITWYKDSEEKLNICIDKQVAELLKFGEHDEALEVIKSYDVTNSFTNMEEEILQDKKMYPLYEEACDLLKNGKYGDGFEILKQLPEDYRNKKLFEDSYEASLECPFEGTHTDFNPIAGSALAQQITFKREFSKHFGFELSIYKKVYWKDDGTISAENNFSVPYDEVEGNVIDLYYYTWTITPSGSLTEIEKGETYTYN